MPACGCFRQLTHAALVRAAFPLVLLGCALAGCEGVVPEQMLKTEATTAAEPVNVVPISPTGPYPKVVVEAEHDFGQMELGEKGEHTFIIKNEGEAPLILELGKASCKCTEFKVDKTTIPPGESAEALVKWEVKDAAAILFQQTAPIHTNDPKNREVKLQIKGEIQELLTLIPKEQWDLHEIMDGRNSSMDAYLVSKRLETFQIKEIKTSNPLLTTEITPMNPKELGERGAKSGYKITVTLQPGSPIGTVSEKLSLHTDVRDGVVLHTNVVGTNPGPIQIYGPNWLPKQMQAQLGSFPGAEGKVLRLTLFVRGDVEGLEMGAPVATSDQLRVTLEPDEKFQGNGRRYVLQFEVPANSKPEVRTGENAVDVTLPANLPRIGEIKLKVAYIAL